MYLFKDTCTFVVCITTCIMVCMQYDALYKIHSNLFLLFFWHIALYIFPCINRLPGDSTAE